MGRVGNALRRTSGTCTRLLVGGGSRAATVPPSTATKSHGRRGGSAFHWGANTDIEERRISQDDPRRPEDVRSSWSQLPTWPLPSRLCRKNIRLDAHRQRPLSRKQIGMGEMPQFTSHAGRAAAVPEDVRVRYPPRPQNAAPHHFPAPARCDRNREVQANCLGSLRIEGAVAKYKREHAMQRRAGFAY